MAEKGGVIGQAKFPPVLGKNNSQTTNAEARSNWISPVMVIVLGFARMLHPVSPCPNTNYERKRIGNIILQIFEGWDGIDALLISHLPAYHIGGQVLVLIAGCGHPTLERLAERAEALYGRPVIGVVGGLHYGNADAHGVAEHIQFLQPHQAGWWPARRTTAGRRCWRLSGLPFRRPIRISFGSLIRFPVP
jgi:hypothetical protein